jgi:ABC-type amino acid transport substrate-binding protein
MGFALAAILALFVQAPEPGAVIRVGMDTRSRPWAFVPSLDYSQEDFARPPRISEAQLRSLQGVDIDILRALEGQMGADLRIVPAAWATIEEGLLDGRYDLIMNGWAPTTRTPKDIVATTPYYEWGLQIAVRADDVSIRSYKDVAGKTLGYFEHPITERTANTLGARRLVALDDSDALFEELAQRRLDVVIEDSTYVRWRVANDVQFRAVGEPLNRHGYHIGVRRSDTALFERVQAGLKVLMAGEEIARIRKRWESPRQ